MAMLRRLQRPVDFDRVLKTRSRASSAHFAVHHLAASPVRRRPAQPGATGQPTAELSTGPELALAAPVDDLPAKPVQAVWLGAVVPKRHARRAVTRSLLKRQIRTVVADGVAQLANGLWVVRLRAPFDRAHFTSAASDALRRQARSELQSLLAAAIARQARA